MLLDKFVVGRKARNAINARKEVKVMFDIKT